MEDDQIELFEQYYFRQMKVAERADFEQKLDDDESFRMNFNAFVLAKEAIEAKEATRLHAQMKDWDREVEPGKMPDDPNNKNRRWGLLLGLLAVIIVVYFSCPASDSASSSMEMNWDSYAQAHIRGIERSADELPKIQDLNQLYLDGNYAGARKFISSLNDSLRKNSEVKLVEALLLYQSKEFEDAQREFESLKSQDQVPFCVKDAASYFFLLTKARLQTCLEDCQANLERFSKDENFLYQKQSSILLQRLKARE